MAWHRIGAAPLCKPLLYYFHYVSKMSPIKNPDTIWMCSSKGMSFKLWDVVSPLSWTRKRLLNLFFCIHATSQWIVSGYCLINDNSAWMGITDLCGIGLIYIALFDKYSLLMHCIKIKSPAKSLLNEQYGFMCGNISFLCVLSCSSEEA